MEEVESWVEPVEVVAEPQPALHLAEEPPPAGLRPHHARGRILLVDDNADMRTYLARLLGREHEVRTAADGWQALQRIDDGIPDLVLTDAMMARMDGFELLRRLRLEPATAALPVIMLSANAGE